MEKISIPEQDVVALDRVAPHVTGLRLMFVNLYAISWSTGEWMLVDCGIPHAQARIRSWAEQHFGAGARPSGIVLTHGHFDHAGSLKELADDWDVPVYVHPRELPYVTGQQEYPPPDPMVGGGLMALFSKLYPRGPEDIGCQVRLLPEDGHIPGFPEWRWLHTPGHTEGHVSLFRDSDRVLIAGDAFSTTKAESLLAVATQRPELHGPPAYFTTDWISARRSVERLAALRPEAVATGHGKPLAGSEVAGALITLAANFDRVARPAHGRYVDRPAA